MADNALWQYTLLVYSQPPVQTLCLKLQEEYEADVNMLLCGCWLGKRGIVWTPGQVAELKALNERFRSEYILTARALRRKLKAEAPDKVYQEAKRFELSLERWQQDEMFRYWQDAGNKPRQQSFSLCAQTNIHRYFDHLEQAWAPAMGELVDAVVAAPPGEEI